ncbi:hypothetical protein Cs7R123_47090 [Catellatospora sp. TT07R-123]|uniref:tetratricopeptide repeat protein n=1 Tax=Catellatospora sp. TT07R-123 TaxID=2733863 RepID=UPI001B071BC5|nr:hypothetical protein [Catellatospora sp. TT07R-123]GHJ47367.1 hypothetical protein Cs7R123_47090 [Catellatospora sp. TT07R-123]
MKLETSADPAGLWRRLGRWRIPVVGAGALLMLASGGLLLTPAPGQPARLTPAAVTADPVARARERLTRLPGDWRTWAQLGMAYLEQGRSSGDPARYAEAEQALRQSLTVHPDGNADALAGLGALAAARHEFAEALRLGRQAVAVDAYHAAGYGVTADALIELGRYDQAWAAVQSMVDLRPDTGSYARASYTWQLRGNHTEAVDLMTRALHAAPDATQAAFTLEHLTGLAFSRGDLDTAAAHVADGLRRVPGHPPLLAMRARIAAARTGPDGDLSAARADWTQVLDRLPLPGYAAEYGDLLDAAGDTEGARQQYDLARAAFGLQAAQGVDVGIEQAAFDTEHGDAATALAEAEAAYSRRPSIAGADTLAWALHTRGRDTEALDYADRALRLGTDDALMLYHRGMISAGLADDPDRARAAREDLAKALELNPYFSVRHARDARVRLTALGGHP